MTSEEASPESNGDDELSFPEESQDTRIRDRFRDLYQQQPLIETRTSNADCNGEGSSCLTASGLGSADEGDEGSPQPSRQPSNELASTDSRIEGSLRPSEVATTAPSSPPASMHEQSPPEAIPTTSTAPEDGPAPQTPNDAHNADDDSDDYERLEHRTIHYWKDGTLLLGKIDKTGQRRSTRYPAGLFDVELEDDTYETLTLTQVLSAMRPESSTDFHRFKHTYKQWKVRYSCIRAALHGEAQPVGGKYAGTVISYASRELLHSLFSKPRAPVTTVTMAMLRLSLIHI